MTTNLQLARTVARQVQIENVVLRRADVEAHFDPNCLPPEISLTQEFRSAYERTRSDSSQDLRVIIDFKFEARKVLEGELGETVADLSATFHLLYTLPSDFEAEERCFEHFAAVNGVYNAWPYWRELVQTSASRIGLPGVVIPVFRPTSVPIQTEEESPTDASDSSNGA